MDEISAVWWSEGRLHLLDQTLLPAHCETLELTSWEQAVEAIRGMRVRGAPALGVMAAYALAMASRSIPVEDNAKYMKKLGTIGDAITAARPTAVNMGWAVERLLGKAESTKNTEEIPDRLLEEAKRIQQEDEGANRRMGKYGAELLPDEGGVLTHCNTGALATGGYGTALGVIRAAWESGKRFRVFNTETRPWLQGARLTSWELQRLEIPNTLLVDSAAGLLMRRGMIRCVVLGADRIAANGDVANKIGTYMLAVLAHENDVPFYVAAPISTVDLNTPSGDAIPIEERLPREVTSFGDVVVAPEGVQAVNPAFDITLHRYITAIITERGVVRPPYISALREVVQQDV